MHWLRTRDWTTYALPTLWTKSASPPMLPRAMSPSYLWLRSFPVRFPRRSMKTLASGVPLVISSGCEGARLVEEGKTGWTFPPGDSDALADVLAELDTDREVVSQMSSNCRRAWQTNSTMTALQWRPRRSYRRCPTGLRFRNSGDEGIEPAR